MILPSISDLAISAKQFKTDAMEQHSNVKDLFQGFKASSEKAKTLFNAIMPSLKAVANYVAYGALTALHFAAQKLSAVSQKLSESYSSFQKRNEAPDPRADLEPVIVEHSQEAPKEAVAAAATVVLAGLVFGDKQEPQQEPQQEFMPRVASLA